MIDDDYDYEFPDDPEPSHFMVDDDDTWDEGEPTLRMMAQLFNLDDEDRAA